MSPLSGDHGATLLASPFFDVVRRGRLVQVARTERAFASAADIDRGHDELARVLDALPRARMGILVDLRLAPARNDPEFEKAMAMHRRRMFDGFARRAVLVKSAVGKLHVQRYARQDGDGELEVFTDPDAALAFAAG